MTTFISTARLASTGVGVTVLDSTGAVVIARTAVGIVTTYAGDGWSLYMKEITTVAESGVALWDDGVNAINVPFAPAVEAAASDDHTIVFNIAGIINQTNFECDGGDPGPASPMVGRSVLIEDVASRGSCLRTIVSIGGGDPNQITIDSACDFTVQAGDILTILPVMSPRYLLATELARIDIPLSESGLVDNPLLNDICVRDSTSNTHRVFLKNKTTGEPLTGLTYDSDNFTIVVSSDRGESLGTYANADGQIETIASPGTYVSPSVGKCRFAEVDSGWYELQFLDSLYTSEAKLLYIYMEGGGGTIDDTILSPMRIRLTELDIDSELVVSGGGDSGGGILSARIAFSSLTRSKYLEIIQGEEKILTFIVEADGRFDNASADAITVKLMDPAGNLVSKSDADITRITEELDVQVFRVTLDSDDTTLLETGLIRIEIAFDSQKAVLTHVMKVIEAL